uniref:Expressed protein n=1 Tax=Schizophyllum commune (strain H4-8 / FGSC 9210) TaxID=578458 RepID=D8QG46_SCHCM
MASRQESSKVHAFWVGRDDDIGLLGVAWRGASIPHILFALRKQPLNALPVKPVPLLARGLDPGEVDEFDPGVGELGPILVVHVLGPASLVVHKLGPASLVL